MVLEVFLAGLLLGFSAIMLAASALAYRRVGGTRILFITLAFLVFAAKAVIFLLATLVDGLLPGYEVPPALLIVDLAIVALLYIAVAKR